jgi:hypothetical protein
MKTARLSCVTCGPTTHDGRDATITRVNTRTRLLDELAAFFAP